MKSPLPHKILSDHKWQARALIADFKAGKISAELLKKRQAKLLKETNEKLGIKDDDCGCNK